MSNQNYQTGGTARSIPEQKDSKEASSTSRLAKSAMESAHRVGSEAASTITGQVKALLDEKVGDGADVVGHLDIRQLFSPATSEGRWTHDPRARSFLSLRSWSNETASPLMTGE